jgi:hypothetical protein
MYAEISGNSGMKDGSNGETKNASWKSCYPNPSTLAP